MWKEYAGELGFEPYPGTLNVKLREVFPKFGEGKRMYNFTCYPGWLIINDKKIQAYFCAHPKGEVRTVFALAPVGIRERFGLKDKSRIRVQVGGD